MGLITKDVEVNLSSCNINWYKNKRYEIPKKKNKYGRMTVSKGTKIKVKVKDLPNCSEAKVEFYCDNCNKILNLTWRNYIKYNHDGKYYCRKCVQKLFGTPKKKQTVLQKSGSILDTHLYLVKYFVNKEDVLNYSARSLQEVLLRCPDCGYENKKRINDFVRYGFSCKKCFDGISYSEKFIFNFLEQLNIEFEIQKIFNWSQRKRFDFYIPSLSCIIETHGEQHYKESFSKINKQARTLKQEQDNDNYKQQLALQNNIVNYIVLDCRTSTLEWIKNNINQSKLLQLLNMSGKSIDWLKCHEYACNSLVRKVCDLWNNGVDNSLQISIELKIDRTTVIKYLKQGVELGWCNYDSDKQKRNKKRKISVICLTTNEIFDSIIDVGKIYKIYFSHITSCCRNKRKSAGKHPITGEKMKWMYYKDYLIMSKNNQIPIQQDKQKGQNEVIL